MIMQLRTQTEKSGPMIMPTISSPSPRPSPSGRGGILPGLWKQRKASLCRRTGPRFSLSLRERAGVRGKRRPRKKDVKNFITRHNLMTRRENLSLGFNRCEEDGVTHAIELAGLKRTLGKKMDTKISVSGRSGID